MGLLYLLIINGQLLKKCNLSKNFFMNQLLHYLVSTILLLL
jgi:hypothetical protein